MPNVEITVNGRQHVVQCGQGEESRCGNWHPTSIVGSPIWAAATPPRRARLLVMATLKIADELPDAYDEIKRLRTALESGAAAIRVPAGVLEQAAQRIEAIAAALESA